MERAGIGHECRSGDAIFLKPNLTYPSPRPGVTTRTDFIEAVATYFLERGCRLTVGEGPGGYNGFSMRAAFETHGLTRIARRLGVDLVELSEWEPEQVPVQLKRGREVRVPVPKRLLDDFHGLISLPVPKVHCITGVSLGLKNLWGCIADTFRIRFHPFFDEILTKLATVLPLRGTVLDGVYGLDENGPMLDGVPKRLNWIAASRDTGAHDVVLTKLLGFDPLRISHLRHGIRAGTVPRAEDVQVEAAGIRPERFALRPNIWNRLAKLTWAHRALTWLVYLSPIAGPIHGLMYRVRARPADLSVRTLRGWTETEKSGFPPVGR